MTICFLFLIRYASQLIITAQILAMKRKETMVDAKEIKEAYNMFYDVKRSQQFIESYEQEFMFSGEGQDQNDNSSATTQMDLN